MLDEIVIREIRALKERVSQLEKKIDRITPNEAELCVRCKETISNSVGFYASNPQDPHKICWTCWTGSHAL